MNTSKGAVQVGSTRGASAIAGPYPGLRPFRREETPIFFGREEQVDQLLEKLGEARFLAIVGESGCGKSSLVLAGLIPALELGFMAGAGARWRVATMRPGTAPLRNLARALLEFRLIGPVGEVPGADDLAFLMAALRRGPMGLADALTHPPLPEGANVLILVDQFEEIFRFRDADATASTGAAAENSRRVDRDEATAFVGLLLAAARAEAPIYVALTMRSDYLGQCAVFQGLPEALNDGQFLTPRLDHDQRRQAIEAPARVCGGEVERALATRVLNDMDAAPDQLPLMQHAMMRIWDVAKSRAPAGTKVVLAAPLYEEVGGLSEALSRHADEALKEVEALPDGPRVAEVLFRALTERAPGRRDTRRPVELGVVSDVAGVDVDTVKAVVEAFRAPGRTFLMPPSPEPLSRDTKLDISHEALIRQWSKLSGKPGADGRREKGWVEQEADSADFYRYLLRAARNRRDQGGELWAGVDLDNALAWREAHHPNAHWAARYGGDFELANDFIDMSVVARARRRREEEETSRQIAAAREHEQAAERQKAENLRIRRYLNVALAGAAIATFMSIVAVFYFFSAQSSARDARTNEKSAKEARAKAEEARAKAEDNARKAQESADQATSENRLANAMILANQVPDVARRYPQRALALAAEIVKRTRRATSEAARLGAGPSDDALDADLEAKRVTAENALRQALASCGGFGLAGHTAPVTAVALTPGGAATPLAATGDAQGEIRIWRLGPDGPAPLSIELSGPDVRSPSSKDGRPGSVDTLRQGDGRSPVTAMVFTAPDRLVTITASEPVADDPAFGGSGTANAPPPSAQITPPPRGTSRGLRAVVWSLMLNREQPAVVRRTVLPVGEPTDVALLAMVVTGDGVLRAVDRRTIWRLETKGPVEPRLTRTPLLPDRQQRAAAFSADGRRLATIDYGAEVLVFDTTADLPKLLEGSPHGGGGLIYRALALSRDGRRLAIGGQVGDLMADATIRTIRLWTVGDRVEPAGGPMPALPQGLFAVDHVAFSLDGRTLAAASTDTIALWGDPPPTPYGRGAGTVEWSPAAQTQLTQSRVEMIAFTPDGRRLLARTGGRDMWSWRWSPPSPGLPALLPGHERAVRCSAISDDGRLLLTGADDATGRLRDLTAGGSIGIDPEMWGPGAATLGSPAHTSSDGRRLARDGDDEVAIWDLDARSPAGVSPRLIAKPPVTSVMAMAALESRGNGNFDDISAGSPPFLSTAGRLTARIGNPPGFGLHDLDRPDPDWFRLAFAPEKAIRQFLLDLSPDGRWLLAAATRQDNLQDLFVFDLKSRQPTARPVGRTGGWPRAMAFNPDGTRLAVAEGTGDHPGRVSLWNLDDPGAREPVLLPEEPPAKTVAAPSRGRRVLRVSRATAPVGAFSTLAFAPDGKKLAQLDYGGNLRLWDVGGPGQARLIHRSRVGREVKAAAGRTIRRVGRAMAFAPMPVALKLAFSPNGGRLAALTREGLHVLRLEPDGAVEGEFSGPASGSGGEPLAFSPDGRLLIASEFGESARLYDLEDRSGPAGGPFSLAIRGMLAYGPNAAFSPAVTFAESRGWLATVLGDNTTRLWDLSSTGLRRLKASVRSSRPIGRLARVLMNAPTDFCTVLAFGPDGRRLAGVGRDGIVRLWSVPAPDGVDLITLAARAAGRNLSEGEWSQYFPRGEYPTDTSRATFPGLPPGAVDAADAPDEKFQAVRPVPTSPDSVAGPGGSLPSS